MDSERPPLWTKPFLLVWAFTFLTFFAAFQLFPTAPLRLIELGASRGESGSFLAVFTVGSSLGALVTGPLGDRIGHRRMMGGAALLFTGIMGAYAIMPTRWGFYALAPVHGAVMSSAFRYWGQLARWEPARWTLFPATLKNFPSLR